MRCRTDKGKLFYSKFRCTVLSAQSNSEQHLGYFPLSEQYNTTIALSARVSVPTVWAFQAIDLHENLYEHDATESYLNFLKPSGNFTYHQV
jgi:hypothetical protein